MKIRSFWQYYFNSFTNPKETFILLLSDNKRLRYGLGFILIPIIGYTIMYIFLAIANGAPSVFTPWLNISKEKYYFWNQFLLAPSMLMSWFVSVSVIQILCVFMGGKGTFEDTLIIISLGISIAMWGTLFHDLIMSSMSALRIIDARQH